MGPSPPLEAGNPWVSVSQELWGRDESWIGNQQDPFRVLIPCPALIQFTSLACLLICKIARAGKTGLQVTSLKTLQLSLTLFHTY